MKIAIIKNNNIFVIVHDDDGKETDNYTIEIVTVEEADRRMSAMYEIKEEVE